jgi:putative DNA primase/helicase
MSFILFARAHGVEIEPSKLFPSDRIRRCGTIDKPRSGNGAYFWDGQRGWVMDWSGEARVIWFEDPNATPWTDEQKREWMDKRRAANASRDTEYDKAAQKAYTTLNAAKLAKHDYLHLKGFPDLEGLVLEDSLLVPMRNVVTNNLQGYQRIYWDAENRKWEKKMLLGMRAKNAVMFMGDRKASEVWLCEGYATGLSLHAALRSVGLKASVVVCFSASNMVAVADQIKGQRYIFADNDESKTGEEFAEKTGLPWTMADTVGFDANDLHKSNGLFALVGKIMGLRNKVLLQAA